MKRIAVLLVLIAQWACSAKWQKRRNDAQRAQELKPFHRRCVVLACCLLFSASLVSPSVALEPSLSQHVFELLGRRCGTCHGKVNPQSDLTVLDYRQLIDKKVVVPKQLAQSKLWERVGSKDLDVVMPPTQPLPETELNLIRRWIEEGAPEFQVEAVRRPFLSVNDVYAAVEADLRKQPTPSRYRYFTIHHLHNNPTVSDADLRLFRAALSKLANSLSWKSAIVPPEPVDKHQTVMRIDLDQLGWLDERLWNKLLTYYPYGLTHDGNKDRDLAARAATVYEKTGSRIPIVRADWFVGTAAVPPLYHEMLLLPEGPGSDRALERMLRVDVESDFVNDRLQRAGFNKSNVSEHNRLVDRHPSAYGAYWKSYDFASTSGKQELIRAPLGPDFPNNRFSRVAFQQDGGEIIFNLPNGLQAYLLIDGKGKRIDRGPINVVFDSKQPLGNKEVINGISCMVCHARGMQPFQDDILQGHTLSGREAQKVQQLFPTQAEFAKVVEQDAQRFLAALTRVTQPFLRQGDDPVTREPVGAIARQFSNDVFLGDVAAELGYPKADELRVLLSSPAFRKFGLTVVAQGKVLKRGTWQALSDQQPYSPFQEVSEALDLGTPERVFP